MEVVVEEVHSIEMGVVEVCCLELIETLSSVEVVKGDYSSKKWMC